jgi:hypothetical protein
MDRWYVEVRAHKAKWVHGPFVIREEAEQFAETLNSSSRIMFAERGEQVITETFKAYVRSEPEIRELYGDAIP